MGSERSDQELPIITIIIWAMATFSRVHLLRGLPSPRGTSGYESITITRYLVREYLRSRKAGSLQDNTTVTLNGTMPCQAPSSGLPSALLSIASSGFWFRNINIIIKYFTHVQRGLAILESEDAWAFYLQVSPKDSPFS